MVRPPPLRGTRIAITRPVGDGDALARRVRALGGLPLRLPGSTLRAAVNGHAARATLEVALACDVAIFTSPAAVRFARKLAPLRGHARVLAPGSGTRRALRRAGVANVQVPAREDSEGLLALPVLGDLRGRRVAIVGAGGGRGLLDRALAARGARIVHAHVYQRLPARLDRRHVDALQRNPRMPLYVLWSSADALRNILDALPDDARHMLLTGTAVASSERMVVATRTAGFRRVLRAASARPAAMLAEVMADRSGGRKRSGHGGSG